MDSISNLIVSSLFHLLFIFLSIEFPDASFEFVMFPTNSCQKINALTIALMWQTFPSSFCKNSSRYLNPRPKPCSSLSNGGQKVSSLGLHYVLLHFYYDYNWEQYNINLKKEKKKSIFLNYHFKYCFIRLRILLEEIFVFNKTYKKRQ